MRGCWGVGPRSVWRGLLFSNVDGFKRSWVTAGLIVSFFKCVSVHHRAFAKSKLQRRSPGGDDDMRLVMGC